MTKNKSTKNSIKKSVPVVVNKTKEQVFAETKKLIEQELIKNSMEIFVSVNTKTKSGEWKASVIVFLSKLLGVKFIPALRMFNK